MKAVLRLTLIVCFALTGCEKNRETGEILFCTNSHISNCVFSIEISVDGNIIGTLDASSEYSSLNCTCPESSDIGMKIDIDAGEHTFTAKELNCVATNRINTWAGIIDVSDNNCETIVLNITD
jgi:hypothetical protein